MFTSHLVNVCMVKCRGLMRREATPILLRRYLSDLVKVVENDGVRRIVLNDPKTRNSLSIPMVQSILSAVMKDETDPKLRCIVLTAEGNVFSGGHNLKHLAINDGRAVFEHFNVLMQKIIESPVPVIASVDGLAAAAGCQLVAQCDIAICTETSSFSTPGANFGVFCSTPGVALVRNVPRKLAAYMLFTGCPITAEVAQKHGLVSHVLKNHDELAFMELLPSKFEIIVKENFAAPAGTQKSILIEREINRIIDTIKAKSRSVVELGKRFLYKQLDMELKMAYSEGKNTMIDNLNLEDCAEGLRSFAEKRKPVWNKNNN